jgi:hypothetical protein
MRGVRDGGRDVTNPALPFSNLSEISMTTDNNSIVGKSNGSESPVKSDVFAQFEEFRLGADGATGTADIASHIKVQRPGKTEFVRVRPGEDYRFDTMLAKTDDGDDYFLVAPSVRELVQEVASAYVLVLGVNHQHVPFLWPLRLSLDGSSNAWNDSARGVAKRAETLWVRLKSDRRLGAYRGIEAKDPKLFGEPKWPNMPMHELLELAFHERKITHKDHAFIKLIEGRA